MRTIVIVSVGIACLACGDRSRRAPQGQDDTTAGAVVSAPSTSTSTSTSALTSTVGPGASPGASTPAAAPAAAPARPAATDSGARAAWSDRPVRREHPGGSALLRDVSVRTGATGTRIEFSFEQRVPDYGVAYAERPVQECGSGEEVALPGNARLVVAFRHAAAHDDDGNATVTKRDRRAVAPNVLRLRLFCDFEGDVSWVAALSRRTGFRVREAAGPPRLVVELQPVP